MYNNFLFYISARFTIALSLAMLSLVINFGVIVAIVRNSGLRKSGYFRLHIFFLIINTIYLMLTCPYRAFMAQSAVYHYWGWLLPGSTYIATHQWIFKAMTDLPHCLLGLQVSSDE